MIINNQVAIEAEKAERNIRAGFWPEMDFVKKPGRFITQKSHGPAANKMNFGMRGRAVFPKETAQNIEEFFRPVRPLFFASHSEAVTAQRQFQKRITADIGKPLIGRIVTSAVEKKTNAGVLMDGLKNLPGRLGGTVFLNERC